MSAYIDDLVSLFVAETGTGASGSAIAEGDTVKVEGLGGLWTVAYVFTPERLNSITRPCIQVVRDSGRRTSLREVHPRRVSLVRKGNPVLEAANRTCVQYGLEPIV